MTEKIRIDQQYKMQLMDNGFDDLKAAQEIVRYLAQYDLRVNHAHYILEIANGLIDSGTSIKSGMVSSQKKH